MTGPTTRVSPEGAGDGRSSVRLTVENNHCTLVRPPVQKLSEALFFRRFSFSVGGSTGIRPELKPFPGCCWDYLGRCWIRSGHIPRACEILTGLGYTVEVDDRRRPSRRLCMDPAFVEGLSTESRGLIEAVDREFLGQVAVRGDRDAYEKT